MTLSSDILVSYFAIRHNLNGLELIPSVTLFSPETSNTVCNKTIALFSVLSIDEM